MASKKVIMEDKFGNRLYPHTMTSCVYDDKGVTLEDKLANLDTSWEGVTGKPNTFPPSEHSHTTVNGKTVESNVPANAKFTDTVYTHPGSGTNPHGTTKANVGLGNVNNWGASTAVNSTSTTTYATASAVKQAYDRAEQAFQSASNGKKLVANAITAKGVSTSTTAEFATMASNIGKINTSAPKGVHLLRYCYNKTGNNVRTFNPTTSDSPQFETVSGGTFYLEPGVSFSFNSNTYNLVSSNYLNVTSGNVLKITSPNDSKGAMYYCYPNQTITIKNISSGTYLSPFFCKPSYFTYLEKEFKDMIIN